MAVAEAHSDIVPARADLLAHFVPDEALMTYEYVGPDEGAKLYMTYQNRSKAGRIRLAGRAFVRPLRRRAREEGGERSSAGRAPSPWRAG